MWWSLLSLAHAEPLPYSVCTWTDAAWERFVPLRPQGKDWEFGRIDRGAVSGDLGATAERERLFRGQIEVTEAVFLVDIDPTAHALFHTTAAHALGANAQITAGGDVLIDGYYDGPQGAGASARSSSPLLLWDPAPVAWIPCEHLNIAWPQKWVSASEALAQTSLPVPVRSDMVLRSGIHTLHKKPGKKPFLKVVNTRDDYRVYEVAIVQEKRDWKKIAGLSQGTLWWGWVPSSALSEPDLGEAIGGLGSVLGAPAAKQVVCTTEAPLVAWHPDHTAEVGRLKPGTHAIGAWPADWPPEALAVAAESTFPVSLPGVYPSQRTHLFAKIVPGCSPNPE